MARRVGRLLGRHVVHKVAERQVDVIQVEAPGRTERGRDYRAAVAGLRRDLEPGRATDALTSPSVETRVGDPRFPGRTGRRDEIGRQRSWAGSPRAAGFVQTTCWPRSVFWSDWRLTPWPGRPKSESAGGVDEKDE